MKGKPFGFQIVATHVYWKCTHATLHLIGCPELLIPQFPNKVPLVFADWKQILSAFDAESV